jgi:hypothetical protein
MDNSKINIAYTFLVAFLAFLGTFLATLFVEYYKSRKANKDNRQNFVLFVRLELQAVLQTTDKIKTSYDQSNFFEFRLIDVLDKSINALEKSRKDAVIIGNVKTQELFLSLTTDLSLFASDIRGIENFKGNELKKLTGEHVEGQGAQKAVFKTEKEAIDYTKEKSKDKLMEYYDLKRRLDDIIKLLSEI